MTIIRNKGTIIYVTKVTDSIKSYQGQADASSGPLLPEEALEAGAQAVYDWRSLGGFEALGSYDLVRRVLAATEAARPKGQRTT